MTLELASVRDQRFPATGSLRNYQRLTYREVFWIANIPFVRFKDGFPTFGRLVKLSRNRDKRIARLHNISLACFF